MGDELGGYVRICMGDVLFTEVNILRTLEDILLTVREES